VISFLLRCVYHRPDKMIDNKQEVVMMARISTMEGVGPAAIQLFEAAGFTLIAELHNFDRHDQRLWDAVQRLKRDPTCGEMRSDGYYRRLVTRCMNIIFRARSAQATDFVPSQFMCPITLDWYHDPVVAPSGHSYSRAAILGHLQTSANDPLTRDSLDVNQLYANRALADATHHYRLHYQKFRILS